MQYTVQHLPLQPLLQRLLESLRQITADPENSTRGDGRSTEHGEGFFSHPSRIGVWGSVVSSPTGDWDTAPVAKRFLGILYAILCAVMRFSTFWGQGRSDGGTHKISQRKLFMGQK